MTERVTSLDEAIVSAAAVAALAVELGVSLAVGFNRRYAPAVRALADWPDRDVVTLQKHRAHPLGPPRPMVFDDFIHVLDTLRFLVPSSLEDLTVSVGHGPDGTTRRLAVQFTGTEGRLATGVMSWTAGLAHELLDVVGEGRRLPRGGPAPNPRGAPPRAPAPSACSASRPTP